MIRFVFDSRVLVIIDLMLCCADGLLLVEKDRPTVPWQRVERRRREYNDASKARRLLLPSIMIVSEAFTLALSFFHFRFCVERHVSSEKSIAKKQVSSITLTISEMWCESLSAVSVDVKFSRFDRHASPLAKAVFSLLLLNC